MESTLKTLPDSPSEWANVLTEQAAVIAEKSEVIDQKSRVIAEQKKRIEVLEEYLRLERHKRFGASSEKNPDQGEIFNEAELATCEPDDDSATDVDAAAEPIKAKRKPGRKPLSDKLPRVQVHIDLSDEEKVGAIDTFYTVVKEELDIIPPQVRVLEYLQEKAVFADCGDRQIKTAKLPLHPIPKSLASVGLLAFIIVSK